MFPFFHKQDDVFVVFVTRLPGYSGGANLRALCASPRYSNPLLVFPTTCVGASIQRQSRYLPQATLNPRGVYCRKVRGCDKLDEHGKTMRATLVLMLDGTKRSSIASVDKKTQRIQLLVHLRGMRKPVLLTVDDDPEVLRAIERDL
ncbi:MAG TPA: hypothetical protein VM709_01170, partial [Candidatus Sulfotelmatobacter sp.]|nr:hypothetical protein [Candidatus Sulfotelmatobacter sp.]